MIMEDSKERSLLIILKDWAETTSSHGIPNISRNKNWILKAIWTVCFLVAFGYCCKCLVDSFTNFLSYPVNTQVNIARQAAFEFPTVTFCNLNPYNINDKNFLSKESLYVFYNLTLAETKKVENTQMTLQYIDYYLRTDRFEVNLTTRKTQSFTIEQMLLSCTYNRYECSVNDFEHYYTSSFGNCYKFNSGRDYNGNEAPIKKVAGIGKISGLRLELFTGYLEKIDFIKSNGILLFVHNSSYNPQVLVEGLSIATGFETDVSVSQVLFNKLSNPYSNCIVDVTSPNSFNSFLYKVTVGQKGRYTQKYCLSFCYQRYMLEKCGCYDIYFETYDGELKRACKLEDFGCLAPEYVRFYSTPDLLSKCFSDCPMECESTFINSKLSQAQFPTPFYADLILEKHKYHPFYANFTSRDDIKKSSLAVNVFFDDYIQIQIDEIAIKPIEQLISDLGGILGLYIGWSLLSIVELVELLFNLASYFFRPSGLVIPKPIPQPGKF